MDIKTRLKNIGNGYMLMASKNRLENANIFTNKALTFYNKFLEKWPDDPVVLNNRALAKHCLGDKNGAVSDLEKAKELANNTNREIIENHLRQIAKNG